MKRQKNTGSRLSTLQRQEQAVNLRMRNMTFQQISEALGVSVSQAHRYVQNALTDLVDKLSEDTKKLRELHRQRIDRMAAGLWPAAENGDCQAIQTMLKLMDREAKLMGLDSISQQPHTPTKHDEIVERLRNSLDH